MNEIIKKLMAHLKWRLSPAGRKFRPKREEIESWAPKRIPPSVPFLLWLAYIFVCLFGFTDLMHGPSMELLAIFTTGFGGWVIAGLLLRQINRRLNRSFLLKSYRNLLESNERFALVEYTRYLERQIKRAKEDPSLGGAKEVERLLGVYGGMMQLLREGSGLEGQGPIASSLAEDAELGEAIVQSYEELKVDPLTELDQRLPEEMLNRIMDLERNESVGAAPVQPELD